MDIQRETIVMISSSRSGPGEGFSIVQLAELALAGLLETRRVESGQSVWIRITESGRQAIVE